MKRSDDLLTTIEAVHAAGLDGERWPQALAAVTRTIGGVGATLEVIDRRLFAHREFRSHGIAPAHQLAYVRDYAATSPRIRHALRQQQGTIIWDYLALDEQAMNGSPFYMEFLASQDLRYAIAGILKTPRDEFGVVGIQRSPRHGHVGRAEIALMERLFPHIQQAFDVARRLKGAGDARHSLEHALDWLADGVALVRFDGKVVYSNAAFQAIARRGDGLGIRRGLVDIAAAEARARFESAIGDMARLQGGDVVRSSTAEFPVPRSSGAPPYLVAVRPLLDKAGRTDDGPAAAIVFVHDPLGRNAAAMRLLREVFGFTESEASLAQSLQQGVAISDYARARAVSVNTVYTHLRGIKEKTGCKRMAELIHKLNELQVPVRSD